MSTSNNLIFSKFLNNITDRSLVVSLTDAELNSILCNYLDEASDLYFKNCLHDLSDREEAESIRDEFVGDGQTDEFVLTDYPTSPPDDTITLFCEVDSVATTDYTFDATIKTFTFTNAPDTSSEIIVGYDSVGFFNETLSNEEIIIISKGMVLSWINHLVYDENKLKEKLTSKDYKSFSPANMLKELNNLKKQCEKDLKSLLVSYSYNGFEGFS